uniref:Uncharacterized protein n=1 Tax=Cucumis melo TaxID=3656 RepID=A0A9I9EM01_CUCME
MLLATRNYPLHSLAAGYSLPHAKKGFYSCHTNMNLELGSGILIFVSISNEHSASGSLIENAI